MITFGFKNRWGGLLRAVAAILLGVIMIVHPADSLILVVKLVAAFLIASGIVSLIYGIVNRLRGGLPLMAVNSVVDIVVGIIFFIYPVAVADILIILLGILLLCLGIFQITALASAARVVRMRFFMFILPVLCAVGGALLLFRPFVAGTLVIVAGIALVVYGLSDLLAIWNMNRAMKVYDPSKDMDGSSKVSDRTDVKDVDYESVDEQ